MSKAVESIQMPAVLLEQFGASTTGSASLNSSEEKNRMLTLLQQKEKLLIESDKERVIQHLQDQIQLRDQKITFLQTTKTFTSIFPQQ